MHEGAKQYLTADDEAEVSNRYMQIFTEAAGALKKINKECLAELASFNKPPKEIDHCL